MNKLTRTIGGRCLLGGFAVALLTVILFAALDNGPNFSAWDVAVSVGPPISTDDPVFGWEACPFISKDGLDLYFRRWHPATSYDIYVSHRDSIDAPWGSPIKLGPNINTSATELCSFVTIDGHWLYFVSFRTGTFGGSDLWVSRRHDKDDDFGWGPPKNLGPNVNSLYTEHGPCIFEDEATGQAFIYFTSNRPGGQGGLDIYVSQMLDKENFMPALPVAELNTPYHDAHAFVRRRDGLEVIIFSNRPDPGAMGGSDLYVSTRPTTLDTWSIPVNLGPNVNSWGAEVRPSISWDGTTLYFWTYRGITQDIYQATRIKLKD